MPAKATWRKEPVVLDLQELRRVVKRIVREEVRSAIRDLLPSLVHEEEQRTRAQREAFARFRPTPTIETLLAEIELLQGFYARNQPAVPTPEKIAEAILLDSDLKASTGLHWRELRRRVLALSTH